jgi:hypothetical protein
MHDQQHSSFSETFDPFLIPFSRVNTFLRLRKHASTKTIPGPSLGNSPLNTSFNNWEIMGSGVFCETRTEVINREHRISCIYNPCGGGVEYLHRDPASHRRPRKGKSKICDSKIWSRVPRDSDLRRTALVRASSMYKWQTRSLVREGAPQKTRP